MCDAPDPARGLVIARGVVAAAVGHAPSVLAPITAPNETWTTDFKGEFRTGDGATAIR